MRKLLWCGLAAVVAGVCGSGYYACCYPSSLVGRCLTSVGAVSVRVNPFGIVTRGVDFAVGPRETSCNQAGEECTPDDPAPAGDPVPQAAPLAGWLDLNPLMRVPPPIIIPEDEPAPGAGQIPNVPPIQPDNVVQAAGAGSVGDVEENHSCPRVMPYASEDETAKRTPDAGEGDDSDPFQPEQLRRMPHEVIQNERNYDINGSDDRFDGPGKVMPMTPAEEPMPEPSTDPTDAGQSGSMGDYHHYEHCTRYSICPYSGKCVEIEPPSESAPKSKKSEQQCEPISAPMEEEESEPRPLPTGNGKEGTESEHSKKTKALLFGHSQDSETNPLQPDVDTMEFRSTDDKLNEYNGGPY